MKQKPLHEANSRNIKKKIISTEKKQEMLNELGQALQNGTL